MSAATLAARVVLAPLLALNLFALGAALVALSVRATDLFVQDGLAIDLLLCTTGLVLALFHAGRLNRHLDGDLDAPIRTVILALLPLPSLAFAIFIFFGPL